MTAVVIAPVADAPPQTCACGRTAIHPIHDMPSTNPWHHRIVQP
jgi:hypothetical protein